MKNIFKYTLLAFLSITMFSCDEDATEGKFGDNPESGWVDFNVATPATTLSAVATELIVPVQVNAPVNATDLTVNFALEEVLGGSPTQVIASSNRSVVIPAGQLGADIEFDIADLLTLVSNGITVEFDVVLTSTSRGSVSVGLADDSQVTRFRVSTPCPVNITDGATYVGTSSRDGGVVQDGYDVIITEVAPLTYMADVSWGPDFVAVLAGAAGFNGQFAAAITFTVDPVTGAVNIISGGSADGSDNSLALVYSISGSGTYDTCNDIFLLTIAEDGIFTNPVTGVEIIFQMP